MIKQHRSKRRIKTLHPQRIEKNGQGRSQVDQQQRNHGASKQGCGGAEEIRNGRDHKTQNEQR